MAQNQPAAREHALLTAASATRRFAERRRRSLFLPAFLSDDARKRAHLLEQEATAAHQVLLKWADLEQEGKLRRKETSLDADFLREVFGDALGYKPFSERGDRYQLERQFSVSGVGTADGALGDFGVDGTLVPVALIELKGADVDVDVDRFNGRTPVQQLWDYLNAAPRCAWGIVSNIVSIRVYHRELGSRAYTEFHLRDLRNPDRFREFYYVLGRGGLLPTKLDPTPRAVRLLERTGQRQREVGDELYNKYSQQRLSLIHHLHVAHERSVDQAIAAAQKLLDRIIFIAFCEDRALLPNGIIDRVWRDTPPLTRATNPRWRAFLDLFYAVDRGHNSFNFPGGYNGGLFRHDDDVDNLQLEDDWTGFFREVSQYDFRDEVNVDVLGHLFEKSITELERIRVGGLFGNGNGNGTASPHPTMPKSAQRKRLGTYYTPPDFTALLVERAVGATVNERVVECARRHGISTDASGAHVGTDAELRAFWLDCVSEIRTLKICDPACGSGAFLIQAYDYLEEKYAELVDRLHSVAPDEAESVAEKIPDFILAENLYGVDLSHEAVEITQLALWIRSARPGRTLADLSHNVVRGNSLVVDLDQHPLAIQWDRTFSGVFERDQPGFDCVIGNPPWERLKLQEREFFSLSAPKIAGAVSAAKRRKLIARLEHENPELFARYQTAKAEADSILAYTRASGRYPLTGKGDINTYALFAELARQIVAPHGRVGLLVPSGIASDNTTRAFFNELMDTKALELLYDFENRRGLFPDVHRSFKFATLVFGGARRETPAADFVFFAHGMDDLEPRDRHIALSEKDMRLVNPNTRTCPIFRSRRDAELTKAVYGRVPILVDKTREQGGNPWGVKFCTMFHQTNDAELFHTAEQLQSMGFKLAGNHWTKRNETFLPLYEAKMIQAYDHRAAGVIVDAENWMRQGQTEPTTLVGHQNPEFVVQPRWWVSREDVDRSVSRLGERRGYFVGFKDITSPTNERTMIAAAIPHSAVTNHFPLLFTDRSARLELCLLANLNSVVFDFSCRQKIGGVTLNFFIVEQLPTRPPDEYAERVHWTGKQTLERWISDRVLKLTCTANDMAPLAEAARFRVTVHKWRPDERARLRAELDAAFFHLYSLSRDDAEYVLSTFSGTRRRDEAETGKYRSAELVLEAYDALCR